MVDPKLLISQLMQLGQSPKVVEQMLFNQYPHLKILSNQMRQSGLSPVEFALQYAKQNNIPVQNNAMLSAYNEMKNMTR